MVAQAVKNLPAMQETQVQSLEKEMAIHSSILAWRMTEEPTESVGWQEVGHT